MSAPFGTPYHISNPIGCLQFRRGTWTKEETNLHMNCKELLAASFAVKAFTAKLQNVHIMIQIDNTTTIAYINKIGSVKRCLLDHYARHLWGWCLQRRITLWAEHIPGRLNTIADRESRAKTDSSDWLLNRISFQILIRNLGQCTIDLFASRTINNFPGSTVTNPTHKRKQSMPQHNHGQRRQCMPFSHST